jgi:hypothetical protein
MVGPGQTVRREGPHPVMAVRGPSAACLQAAFSGNAQHVRMFDATQPRSRHRPGPRRRPIARDPRSGSVAGPVARRLPGVGPTLPATTAAEG